MAHVSPCVLQFAGKMTPEDLQAHLAAQEHAAYATTSAQVLSAEAAGLQPPGPPLHALPPGAPGLAQAIQVSEALSNVIQSGLSTTSPS